MGSMEFTLALHPIIEKIKTALLINAWYVDEVGDLVLPLPSLSLRTLHNNNNNFLPASIPVTIVEVLTYQNHPLFPHPIILK